MDIARARPGGFDTPVVQVAWCLFSASTEAKCSLCVLQPEVITVFEGGGAMHMVPLPFRARRLWAACDGLIVEKTGLVVHNTLMHGRSAPSLLPRAMSVPLDEDGDEQPMLFSLLHPLEELRPLQFTSSDDTAYQLATHGVEHKVLFCSTQVSAPLLVTQHELSQMFFVWVMRQRPVPAKTDEYGTEVNHDAVEVVLEEVWSEPVNDEPPAQIFVANDWCGDRLLCFVFTASGTLRTLRLSTDTLTPTVSRTVSRSALTGCASFSLASGDTVSNVIAAVPVVGTGRPCLGDTGATHETGVCTDLLVLDTSNTLALYAGDRRLCMVPCNMELKLAGEKILSDSVQSLSPREATECADPPKPVGLQSAVGNRVSLECADGHLYRVALDFGIASPVVSACLIAMQDCSALPQSLAFSLRTDTIRCSHNQATLVAPDVEDVEWFTFCRIILTLVDEVLSQAWISCGETQSLPDETSPGALESLKKKQRSSKTEDGGTAPCDSGNDGGEGGDDSDWDALISSDYHKAHPLSSLFDQLAKKHPSKACDVSTAQMRKVQHDLDPGTPNTPGSPSADEPEPEHVASAETRCNWLAGLSTSCAEFGLHVSTFMQVIHLVYEDLKLDVLTASERLLRPLATLLHKLALRLNLPNHADHYVRDFGEIFTVGTSVSLSKRVVQRLGLQSLATAPAPSIYGWLHACLRGRSEPTLAVTGCATPSQGGLDPDGMGCELCENTRKLCFLYTLLVERNVTRKFHILSTESSTEYAAGSSIPGQHSTSSFGPHMRSVSAVMFEGRHGTSEPVNFTVPGSPLARSESDGYEVLGWVARFRAASAFYTAESVHEKVVLGMVSVELTPANLNCLPVSVAIPLRESLWRCRHHPPINWPRVAYELMGRDDLARSTAGSGPSRASNNMATMNMPSQHAGRKMADGFPFDILQADKSADDKSAPARDADCDGTELGIQLPHLRFGRDQRLKEVQRMMRSSRPGLLRLVRAPESNDHDFIDQQQKKLQQLSQRTMAIPVGRGMFTLFTGRMTISDPLSIPPLCLSGKVPPNNAVVSMDVSSLPTDLQKWPSFHNGVAAGLRLPPQQSHATRTWIVYNKPENLTDEHAGVLLALGLTGQLSSLASADLVWYLSQRHETTAVGVMLGMAAARRGSMDNTISKMLCMHILAFHPPTFPELDVSSNLQTAAIMGIALLFQGTANRFMTEVLLGEIGRRASDSISVDREGYSLAAGIALGFVTLGRGNSAAGLADLKIGDRLRRFMTGGKDPDAAALHEHGLAASNYASQAQCSRIKEGEVVNVDITAPAATLALGLMYLRTNNVAVGEQLSIPDTHFLLDYVRPDFILLRVLSRNLVLWDSIEATEEWVQAQIPSMIQTSLEGAVSGLLDEEVDIDYAAVRHAHWNIIAAACMSLGLRFAGQADLHAQQLLLHYIHVFQSRGQSKLSSLDKPIMESCFDVVILSLSLVMAGTGHLDTTRLFRSLRKRSNPDLNYGNHMAVHMAIGFLFLGGGCATLHTSNQAIAALVASLYPRFPLNTRDNRYHLQAFRHLYVLAVEPRCIETRDVDTNEPVYVPLKITLRPQRAGGTEQTLLRTSPCLLPEIRRIARIDVDSPRYWPQALHLTEPGVATTAAGGDGNAKPWTERRIIYVKRKTGYLPYADDPHGVRSILARPFPKDTAVGIATLSGSGRPAGRTAEFVRAFSADPNVLAFVRHFCAPVTGDVNGPSYTGLLYECLTRNKPEMLQAYMSLAQIVRGLGTCRSCEGLWNLKVLFAYYECCWGDGGNAEDTSGEGEPLIQLDFQAWLKASVEEFLENGQRGEALLDGLRTYALDASCPALLCATAASNVTVAVGTGLPGVTPMHFALFLVYFGVAPPTVLGEALGRSGMLVAQTGAARPTPKAGLRRLDAVLQLAACLPVHATVQGTLKVVSSLV